MEMVEREGAGELSLTRSLTFPKGSIPVKWDTYRAGVDARFPYMAGTEPGGRVIGESALIGRNREVDSKVNDTVMRAVSGTSEVDGRTTEKVSLIAKVTINDWKVPDSVHLMNTAGFDAEQSTKKSKEALELDVKGKFSRRELQIEGKMPVHRGGVMATELDYLQLEMQSVPGRELSLESVTAVEDIGTVVIPGVTPQFPTATTGLINGQRVRTNSILQPGVPGREPGMTRNAEITGVAPLLNDRSSITEPVEVEGDTGIAVAMGLEPQVHPSETPEHERQRRRPRGGKRLNLTGGQRRTYRKVREAEPV